MYKFIITLTASTVIALSAFAEGKHNDNVSDHNSHAKSSHEGHGAHLQAHNHETKKGAVGYPAKPSNSQRSIDVSLSDNMRISFSEDLTELKSGTVINFVVTNEGEISHEFSIGNQAEQKAHAKMMRQMPGMVHNDGNTVTLAPGETKRLAWHFVGDDQVVFSCNIPGHFEAGMFRIASLKL